MKKLLFLLLLMTIMSLSAAAQKVDVIYFHGKQRCKTCMAIEREAKTAVNAELNNLVQSGKVRLVIVDFTTGKGKEIAQKYKVSYSSLFVVTNPGKDEKAEDLTRFAFANARNNPEVFRKALKDKINEGLKK